MFHSPPKARSGCTHVMDFDTAVKLTEFQGRLFAACEEGVWELYVDDDGNWQKKKIAPRE